MTTQAGTNLIFGKSQREPSMHDRPKAWRGTEAPVVVGYSPPRWCRLARLNGVWPDPRRRAGAPSWQINQPSSAFITGPLPEQGCNLNHQGN